MNELKTAHLELKLREAFRVHHLQKRARKRLYKWVAGAVAASLTIGAIWMYPSKQETAKAPVSTIIALEPERVVARLTPQPAPKVPKRVRAAQHAAKREVVATEFLELPYSPKLTSQDGAQVVRVSLPRASMMTVGLPFDQERVSGRIEADVLMGADGIARAIRFVH